MTKTLEYQRQRRLLNGNADTRKYERTKQGFLMRKYRNMKSRVTGVQKIKYYLYEGKDLLPKEKFYEWSLQDDTFHRLFEEWERSDYKRSLTPSVDRIDPSGGYSIENIHWITHGENSSRGAIRSNGGTSQYIGVSYSTQRGVWVMQIARFGKHKSSLHKTEEEAHEAYKRAELELLGVL